MIYTRRVYEKAGPEDGALFLVDRLWPRGIRKDSLPMQSWLPEVAPGNELRQWFAHDPAKWAEFRRRYFTELEARPDSWKPIAEAARRTDVTLLYAAKDTAHNNAIALKEFLEKNL